MTMPERSYITCMIGNCPKNNKMHEFTDPEMKCYSNLRKLATEGKELDLQLVK